MLTSLFNIFEKKTKPNLKLRFVNGYQFTCKGLVGLETPFKDVNGKRIHVGDIVDVYDKNTGKKTWTNFVCYSKNMSDLKFLGEYVFAIMGMYPTPQQYRGLIGSDQFVRISKSHKELVHGDRYDLIHALEIDDEMHPETAYDRVEEERPVLRKFHLIGDDGLILKDWGVKTAFTDCFGRTLYTGDTVSVYDKENTYMGIYYVGKVPPVDPNLLNAKCDHSKSMILGLTHKTAFSTRNFDCREHRLELHKRFEQAQNGEVHSGYRTALQ